MRKLLISALLVCGAMIGANAQSEIGVRFGENVGGNVAIDAILSLGEFSRIHADVSFGDGIGVDAIYDFLYRPLGAEALYWYAGVGVNMFLGDPFTLGIPGELGIEYRFNGIPISLSADWRPTLRVIDNTDFLVDQFGINIRYILGGS